jgi:predicted transcriptional regulator
MEKSDHIIDWQKKYQTYMRLYGGRLLDLYGLTNRDVAVYVFLLTKKWYTDDYKFSKNLLSNELNSIPTYYLENGNQIKHDPGKVEKSLIKLARHRFVSKCKNMPKKKAGHRNPEFIYEAQDLTVIYPEIEKELENKKKDMLNLLGEIGNVEEDSLHYKNQMEKRK